jgi:hypothetical protein
VKPVNADTIVHDTIEGLINAGLITREETKDIVSTWHYYADYSYPTPTVDRDEVLSVLIPWLEERGIYSRGRFGMWKYEVANTDHTLMQGVECVNRLLLGEPETTIGVVYKVTEDGRHAAVHERPAQAGSGEKRAKPGHAELKPGHAGELVIERAALADAKVGDLDAGPIGEEEVGIGEGA